MVRGLLWMTGLVDTTPLRDLLDEVIEPPKREVYLGVVDMGSGEYEVFNHTESFANYKKAVYASAAFPAFFPTENTIDRQVHYLDGGVIYVVDIPTVVNRCRELGYDEDQIVIDVVLCDGATKTKVDAKQFSATQMALRYLEINGYYGGMHLVERAMFAYSKVNFRYLIHPTKELPNGLIPMNFDPAEIEEMIQ